MSTSPVAEGSVAVLVVEPSEVARWGFARLLSDSGWVDTWRVVGGSREALAAASEMRPDVALIEASLDGGGGLQLCVELRKVNRATRVLLASPAARAPAGLGSCIGVAGIVPRGVSAEEIAYALRAACADPVGQEEFDATSTLSKRECEILRELARGATNREIAANLFIAPDTVKQHASVLYRKLQARNRADAAKRAQLLGLL